MTSSSCPSPTATGWPKRRPAVVVSGPAYNQFGDLVIAAVTSQPVRFPTDYALLDWQAVGLQHPSTVRMLLATVAAGRVVYKLGELSDRDWSAVQVRPHLVFA